MRVICQEFGLEVIRADEEYGPGLIVADVARQIVESKVVIAEITPANPNVYYEVGFAHALNKPTILIAEKPTKLPFDVAPHRVLFYENSINGKARLEAGLRKHLHSILSDVTPGASDGAQ
jgi:nucleoside 2-deoxyribosyltransferase